MQSKSSFTKNSIVPNYKGYQPKKYKGFKGQAWLLAIKYYIEANNAMIFKIQKLEKYVVDYIKNIERKEDTQYVKTNIIVPTLNIMKKLAINSANFINNNSKGQLEVFATSKSYDTFGLGALMMDELITYKGLTSEWLLQCYPIKNITNEDYNLFSGGIYEIFFNSTDYTINNVSSVKYHNIAGSALLNSKQAALISLYSNIKKIDILSNYNEVINSLKSDKIIDATVDGNLQRIPVKLPIIGTPPLAALEYKEVEPSTLYSYGGTSDTEDAKKDYPPFDCSQYVKVVFGIKSDIGTSNIMSYLKALCATTDASGNINIDNYLKKIQDKETIDFIINLGQKLSKVIHCDCTKINGDKKLILTKKAFALMQDTDIFIFEGHMGFVSIDMDGLKNMLSYTRNRGNTPLKSFVQKYQIKSPLDRTKQEFFGTRTNLDGSTIEKNSNFFNLLSIKNFYLMQLSENNELSSIIKFEEIKLL